jgi:hypothetical protein
MFSVHCYFQRQDEWLGLKHNHSKLFEKAKAFEKREREKFDWDDGKQEIAGHGYTWSSQGSIDELVERAEAREKKNGIIAKTNNTNERWQDALRAAVDDDPEDQACLICSL